MEETIRLWSIMGAIFVMIAGSLFHFIYEWSAENPIVGIFGAVNESSWEHLKLLFWPSLLISFLEYIVIGKSIPNFLPAKAVTLYLGIFLILVLFYTYTGILGKNYLILDILVFIISVLISEYVGYFIMTGDQIFHWKVIQLSVFAILLLAAAFIVFTFYPPALPLFLDPVSGKYGMRNEK